MYNITNRRARLTAKCYKNNSNNNKKIFFLPVRVLPGSFFYFFKCWWFMFGCGPRFWAASLFHRFFFFFWLSLSTLPHRMTALWAALWFFSKLVRSPNYPPTSPWWIRRENCDITATWNQRRAMLKPHRCRSETKGSIKCSCCTHQNPRFSSSNYLHSVFVSFLFPCLNKKGRETKSEARFPQLTALSRPPWPVKSQTKKSLFSSASETFQLLS